MFASLRVTLLGVVERVLRRWLGYVTRLEPVPARDVHDVPLEREPMASRTPAPPDHWVDLVRQYAPQLLDGNQAPSADGTVIDYRAPETPVDASAPAEWGDAPVKTRRVAASPPVNPVLTARKALHNPPVSPTVSATPSKRPLRLEQVRTRVLESHPLDAHAAQAVGTPAAPPEVNTVARSTEGEPLKLLDTAARSTVGDRLNLVETAARSTDGDRLNLVDTVAQPVESTRQTFTSPDAPPVIPTQRASREAAPSPAESEAQLHTRYRPVDAQPVREVPTTSASSGQVTAHFSDLPFEQQADHVSRSAIRETRSSLPPRADVSMVHTRSQGKLHGDLHQQRTRVPQTPPQVVMRPTDIPAALNVTDVSPDRWPSLPESPSDDLPTAGSDQWRERLIREQEGRAWSE